MTVLSSDLTDLRSRMKDFIDGEIIPSETVLLGGDRAAADRLDELKAEAKKRGLWALGHPAEIGGGGLPFMDFVYLNEIIGRSEWGQVAVGSVSMQDSIMLHLYASDEQRERWLKPLVAGDIYPSVGLTEPEVAGSDPTQMQTKAVLDGSEWVINGHKWFTTGAHRAAFTTVFAMTDPDAASAYAKFSAIIVPTDTPGYDIVRAVPTMGTTHGDHCEVMYRDVRVPMDNLLGERG
jgi:alkylation response protein AidB-like acyl-CoA dehydrogenase